MHLYLLRYHPKSEKHERTAETEVQKHGLDDVFVRQRRQDLDNKGKYLIVRLEVG
jgi:hypothetical protein